MPAQHRPLAESYSSALVTGASSGLGQAIATLLLEEGLIVYGTSRQPEACRTQFPGIHWLSLEASTAEGVADFIKNNEQLLNNLDILINNSGSALFGEPCSIDEEAESALIYLLLRAPMRLSRAVLEAMRERERGIIVNISSLAAEFPLPYMQGYVAGKAELSAYTRSLMVTESSPGIHFIDFRPGDLRTAFNRNMARNKALSTWEKSAWKRLEDNLEKGPEPEKAARDLLRAMRKERHQSIRSGSFFQSRIAPLGTRLLSWRMLRWALRSYYRLG